MQVEMTQRATIALQKAEGELKQGLTEVLRAFESGKALPVEQVRSSNSRPGVLVARIKDYRLFYQPGEGVIQVLDIVPRSEAYQ